MQTQTINWPARLGAATVLEWLVTTGDQVAPTTPVARVLTAEAEWVVPAQCEGVVAELQVPAGGQIDPGAPLARCALPPRARATPLARRIAAALGIDLSIVRGRGPGGRIERADVLMAADRNGSAAEQPDPAHVTGGDSGAAPSVRAAVSDAGPMQSVSAPTPSAQRQLTTSPAPAADALIPLTSATIAVNLQPVLQRCAAQSAVFAARGLQSTPLSAVIAAAAALFPAHPLINAAWSDTVIVVRHRYHVAAGMADGQWALITDAGDLTERGIARALTHPTHDLTAATMSIVITADWWRIAPPLPGTVAALTLSEPQLQPIAVDATTLAIGAVARFSLCYDARALDHVIAMSFLTDLCRQLSVSPLS